MTMGIRKTKTFEVDQSLYDLFIGLQKTTGLTKSDLLDECMFLMLIKYGIVNDEKGLIVTDPSVLDASLFNDKVVLIGQTHAISTNVDLDLFGDFKALASQQGVKLRVFFEEGLIHLFAKYRLI